MIRSIISIKNKRLYCRINTFTLIFDGYFDTILQLFNSNIDFSRFWGIFNGIVDKIDKDLFKTLFVGKDICIEIAGNINLMVALGYDIVATGGKYL
ncbi:hypothetical protein D3C81_1791280 [compost metagenome]